MSGKPDKIDNAVGLLVLLSTAIIFFAALFLPLVIGEIRISGIILTLLPIIYLLYGIWGRKREKLWWLVVNHAGEGFFNTGKSAIKWANITILFGTAFLIFAIFVWIYALTYP